MDKLGMVPPNPSHLLKPLNFRACAEIYLDQGRV